MKMNFGLVFEWMDEDTGCLFDTEIDWFDTKEQFLNAFHNARIDYMDYVDMGRLVLHSVVKYTPQEIELNF